MRIDGTNEPIRPATPQTMDHGSYQTKGVSREGMASNTANMELFAASQKPRDWDAADRGSSPSTRLVDAMRRNILT